MRLHLPDHKRLIHQTRIPIRWGDMDAMGHVNNTVYFRYMESARVEWRDALPEGVVPAGHGMVVVNAFCNYQVELRYPGTVDLRMYAANPGRTSVETYYEMFRDDDPATLVASGGAKMVWFDTQAHRSIPLPDALRALLTPDADPAAAADSTPPGDGLGPAPSPRLP